MKPLTLYLKKLIEKGRSKLYKKERKKVALIDIRNAIAQMEGWNITGSLAQRNNNPGNLRFVGQAGAVLGDGGFAKWGTAAEGQAALDRQIALDASRGLSLSEFISKYAPPSENKTSNYLAWLEKSLGISGNDRLADAIGTEFDSGSGIPEDGGINTVIVVFVVAGLAYSFFK